MRDDCLAVEFEIQGDDCPLADATRATGATIEASPPQLRYDDNVLLQFTAARDDHPASTDDSAATSSNDRAAAADGLAAILDDDDRLRYLHVAREDGRNTYRCLSKHPCVVHQLVSTGCILESVTYADGRARVVGAVVGRDVLAMVMERAGETVGVTLNRAFLLESDADGTPARQYDLTPKQEACLRAALEAGYFAIPREADAGEVAAALGISKSAFLDRLRRAQARVFGHLFNPESA